MKRARALVAPLAGLLAAMFAIATTGEARAHELLDHDLLDRFLGREREKKVVVVDGEVMPEKVEVISSMQLRTTASSTLVSGESLPVDSQMGMLCGSLLAWRLGAHYRGLGAYGIVGGGTWTVFRHRLPTTGSGLVQVDTMRAGYGFVGVGGEWQLYKSIVLAAEVDLGGLALQSEDDVVMAPSPARTVRSAVAGLRFTY
jgi:hypothetical protein